MQGGTIEDGLYTLQSVTYYGAPGDLAPTVTEWLVCGSTWTAGQWTEIGDGGDFTAESAIYSASLAGSQATLTPACSTAFAASIDIRSFTASPGQLIFLTSYATTPDAGLTWDLATFVQR
jgi:hypothetical protein